MAKVTLLAQPYAGETIVQQAVDAATAAGVTVKNTVVIRDASGKVVAVDVHLDQNTDSSGLDNAKNAINANPGVAMVSAFPRIASADFSGANAGNITAGTTKLDDLLLSTYADGDCAIVTPGISGKSLKHVSWFMGIAAAPMGVSYAQAAEIAFTARFLGKGSAAVGSGLQISLFDTYLSCSFGSSSMTVGSGGPTVNYNTDVAIRAVMSLTGTLLYVNDTLVGGQGMGGGFPMSVQLMGCNIPACDGVLYDDISITVHSGTLA